MFDHRLFLLLLGIFLGLVLAGAFTFFCGRNKKTQKTEVASKANGFPPPPYFEGQLQEVGTRTFVWSNGYWRLSMKIDACNRGNLCPWTEECRLNQWRSRCKACGLCAQGSCQG